MKLAIAVLALLCLGMSVNATGSHLGVRINKTGGVRVNMPDLTVPRVTLPEVDVAVNVKKPSLDMTKISLPDFTIPTMDMQLTIPTIPKPNVDLSALTALLSKSGNSSVSLARMLTKSNIDLSALQLAVNAALQRQASLTADAAAALQTLANAVYQAKYNVTSRIADMALMALSKRPNITIQTPEVDLSGLVGMLNKAVPNITMPELTMPQVQMPNIDLQGHLASLMASNNISFTVPAIDKQALVSALTKGKVNLTNLDINNIVDMAAMQQSMAQLASSVEMPNVDVNQILNAINTRKVATINDLVALLTMAGQKKSITADMVGFLNSLKEQKTVNVTLPTLQMPQMPNISGIMETVNTIKNVTATIAADELKSAAILSWLNEAGFYQIREAVSKGGLVQGGSVTVNLGKQAAHAHPAVAAGASASKSD